MSNNKKSEDETNQELARLAMTIIADGDKMTEVQNLDHAVAFILRLVELREFDAITSQLKQLRDEAPHLCEMVDQLIAAKKLMDQ